MEVLRAINGVKLAIEHISQLKGEQIPMGQTKSSVNRWAFTIKEPIGVVASISAFNHPLNLIIHQNHSRHCCRLSCHYQTSSYHGFILYKFY